MLVRKEDAGVGLSLACDTGRALGDVAEDEGPEGVGLAPLPEMHLVVRSRQGLSRTCNISHSAQWNDDTPSRILGTRKGGLWFIL